MGKFTRLLQDVFSIFGTTEWIAENIKVVPQNFVSNSEVTEYLRVSVIPSEGGVNTQSTNGLIMIDIFTPQGMGPFRASKLADTLDSYLLGKSFNVGGSTTQVLKTSNMRIVSSKESLLCHAIYQVQFNHFHLEV